MALTLAILACALPGSSAPSVKTVMDTAQDTVPVAGSQPATPTPITSLQPGIPSTGMGATPTPGQPLTITHVAMPGPHPSPGPYIISDSDSSVTAPLHHPAGGDIFDLNLFERPFNANAEDIYLPQVDIQQASMTNGSPWVYGSITLKNTDPNTNTLDASYALEMDLSMDGRGDLLIVANQPAEGPWSTAGVQVFQDADHDVGGKIPIHSDASPQGDGYEQKIFDNGQGADADLAWSRVDSEQPNMVWFAFKSSLVNNADKWLWGAWAQKGGLHPELFDYNDHFSASQAGSPLPDDPNYPLNMLAELDNTCRWAVGFNPNGSEPGLCPLLSAATSTPKPTSKVTKTPSNPTATLSTVLLPTHTAFRIKIPPIFFFTPTPTKPLIIKINPGKILLPTP